MRVDFLDDFVLGAVACCCAEVRSPGGVQKLRRTADILVVHAQQAAIAAAVVAQVDVAAQAEPIHAVVVVASAQVVARLAAVTHIVGNRGIERVASGVDHGGGVPSGHVHAVVPEALDGGEIETGGRCRARGHGGDVGLGWISGHQAGGAETGGGHRRNTAKHHVAAADARGHQLRQVGCGARVLVQIVGLDGHRRRCGFYVHLSSLK